MKKHLVKTVLSLLPTLLFGTLQAQTTIPQNYIRLADSTFSSESIIRSIDLGEKMCNVLYTYHHSTKGEFALSDPNRNIWKASTPSHIQVADMKIVGKYVYWCGRNTRTNKGVVGYFDAFKFFGDSIYYYMVEFPNILYRDTNVPMNGCYYSTYNIFKLEVLSTAGAFPHIAVLCNMACGSDTTTGIGEIVSLTNGIAGAASFLHSNVAPFYDMTLTDNYLLATSTKGPGSYQMTYMIQGYQRSASQFLSQPCTTLFQNRQMSSSGLSLIEATGGDDFIVAYRSINDTTQPATKIYLDRYTGVTSISNCLTPTYSAMVYDIPLSSPRNKMYDLSYDKNKNVFWLLHEVNTSHLQRILRINGTLTTCSINNITNCCIQSIDYANNQWVASGYNTSTNLLMEYSEQSTATISCMSSVSSTILSETPFQICEEGWPLPLNAGFTQIDTVSRAVTRKQYNYICENF